MCDNKDDVKTQKEEPAYQCYMVDPNTELPGVSIVMPTYNRSKFLPLIKMNIDKILYDKSKIELCILDDGDEPLIKDEEKFKKDIYPIALNYKKYKGDRLSIGEKRNRIVKDMASYKYLINMDDYDIYFPSYIMHSINQLQKNNKGLVGTNDMIFLFSDNDDMALSIDLEMKTQINEGTMCYTKKYFNSMDGFSKKGTAEGVKMIDSNENKVGYTNINLCMCCIVHDNNTENKEIWRGNKIEADFYEHYPYYKDIILSIFDRKE